MKSAGLLILLTSFIFASCSDKYEQEYNNFTEFDKASLRNKAWFPNLIFVDSYDLKSVSYLDPLCAFGMFSYLDNNLYDSAFTNPNSNKIDFSKFEQKVKEHVKRKPNWFLNLDNISKTKYQAIQNEHFFIVRQVSNRKIFFILSN